MSILGLVLFLIVICLVLYFCNLMFPGLITPEANRLIWIVITVVVLVCLLLWVFQMFGLSLEGAANWGPRLGPR
jgi:hypothetical protein